MYDKLTQLLDLLSVREYKTAESLAAELGTSVKTTRTRLKELNALLLQHAAEIVSKPRYGYILTIHNVDVYQEYLKSIYTEDSIPVTADERSLYLLAFLINHDDYIKVETMADFLYVSKNTLSTDLKRVEQILSSFQLTLERRPNYGMKISGTEFNIRLCMEEYFVRYDRFGIDKSRKREKELEMIGAAVLKTIQARQVRLSEIAFQNVANHIYLSVKRSQKGRYVTLAEEDIAALVNADDRTTGHMLVEEIERLFEVSLPQEEILYIIIHLAGKRFVGSEARENNFVIKEHTDELVVQMLEVVYHNFKLDLRKNFPLRMALNQHLIPLDIRMRFGIPCKNPLLSEVKEKYMMAYIVASQAAIVLKNYYEKNISDDEISFLALIFALALENTQSSVNKKNVLIVCASGKGSSQLLIYKYKKEFDQYLDHVYDCSIFDLDYFDFSKVDYIFTTVPIKKEIPVPIFEINVFLENRDIENVRKILELGDISVLHKYYKPELFLTDVGGSTKEEVIKNMCDAISMYQRLPDGFYESVLQRESIAHTDFGNAVAMPHPLRTMTKDTFVCVAILKKPIVWSVNKVQIVFLVSISMEADEDLHQFYQLTTELMLKPGLLNEVLAKKDFQTLMCMLCAAEE